ncbi:hypothetical protein B7R74_17290 [Yersinia pseudotuberculosis]|uniref:phage tail assembly protein n=1 Tax=Yersinia pseudotuberculosis complex TaxID=1649845 RepID=UPI00061C7903|nr:MULTISPECIES: phage tail assembly protein [Yersinia pseudotuberculosis complex]MBK1425936.1 hypothetical protein [Yersinia pseudotuberculosis]MBK1426459.1 hypothetical protein [Yersinia pseudotuberculosis]MBK1426464.1 hypothetical protein [Yersinia pseudotuberculosis]PSH16011.1 hypothetical protein B7R74_17290 [Yersinia pseudotuberculosis]CNC00223.1 Mu-like prophage FluMu protein gp41 [Yersinia similis]
MLIQLKHGLSYGKGDEDVKQFDVELRELTAGDLIESEQASERVVMTEKGPALLSSPATMGYEMVRRSISRIGIIQGPLSMTLLKTLHQDDLELLLYATNVQSDAAMATVKQVIDEGR